MENLTAATAETQQSPPPAAVSSTSSRGPSSRRSRRSSSSRPPDAAPSAAAKRRNSGDDSTVPDAHCQKKSRISLDASLKERKPGPPAVAEAVESVLKEDDTPCCICMCDIDRPELSSLDGCIHQYCFECIAKWAKTENTCPQCKIRFTKISRVYPLRNNNGKRCSKKDPNNTLTVSDRSQQERTAALEGMVFRGASGNPIYFDSEDDDAVAFAVGLALSLQYVSGENLHQELARHLRRRGRQESSEDEDEDDDEILEEEEDESDESSDAGDEQQGGNQVSHPLNANNIPSPPSRPGGVAHHVEQAPPISTPAAALVHNAPVTTAAHSNIPLTMQVMQEQQRLQVQALREMERMLPPFIPPTTSGIHHLFHPVGNQAAYTPSPQPHGLHHHHHAVHALAELSSAAASGFFAGRHLLPVDYHRHTAMIMPPQFHPQTYHQHHPTHHGISIGNLTAGNALGHFALSDLFFPALAGLHHHHHQQQSALHPPPAHRSLAFPMNMTMAASQAAVHPGPVPSAVFPTPANSYRLPPGNTDSFGAQQTLPPPLAPGYPPSTSQYHPGFPADSMNGEWFFGQHHPHTQFPPAPDRSHMP